MASNTVVQVKRTAISGRPANTTTISNPGELALNMTDGILYSTNGSIIFEIGANNTNVRVSNTLTVKAISANSSVGAEGEVLTSNGSGVYWHTVTGYAGSQGYTGSASTAAGYAGSRGYDGSQGYTGSQGTTGYTGSVGYVGSLGYTGSQGYTGSGYTGSQGTTGYTGSFGYSGSVGYAGSQGYTGSGYTGSQGYSGSVGYSGSKGYTGSAGNDGDLYATTSTTLLALGNSGTATLTLNNTAVKYTIGQNIVAAYDINNIQYGTVSSYNSGTGVLTFVKTNSVGSGTYVNWTVNLLGVQGAIGYTGSLGYAGSQGYTGSVGYAGSQGYTGSFGYSGSQGYTGSVGYVGSKGDIGYVGSKGDIGYTGSVGYAGSQGVIGYSGSLGYTGSQGYSGSVGYVGSASTVIGYTGSLGYTGSNAITWRYKTANYTALNNDGILADTTAGEFTITLPASPPTGYYVVITDVSNTFAINKVTVDGNGQKIQGLTYDSIFLNVTSAKVEFIYDGAYWAVVTTSGTRGYSGSKGQDGTIGYNGSIGYTGSAGTGYTGSAGVNGYSGSVGYTGSLGYTGSAGNNNLIWTSTNTSVVTLTGYANGVTYTVRSAAITANVFTLTLATFTPTLAAYANTASSLNWDQTANGFTVVVTNPADVTSQWISNVVSVTATSGNVSALSTFNAAARTATPAGGVSWNQTFTANTGNPSYIRPISTTITGGSAAANVAFNVYDGATYTAWGNGATFSVIWATPTLAASASALSGNTFLQTYTSVAYAISITGITTAANYSTTVTPTGGTISNASGSGTFTFTTAINKDNTGTTKNVVANTVFTRPSAVTGTSYSANLGSTATVPSSVSFVYPTYYVFTADSSTPPTVTTLVNGNVPASGVTANNSGGKVLSTTINNPGVDPQALWFCVRSSASQPTTFQTGASAALLSSYIVGNANTVALYPNPLPSGWTTNENYSCYAITLQPGNTYVSIA